MTPEREREIRAACERLSPDLVTMRRDLLAEVDRLRALPVIATCGSCGWARDGGHSYDGPLVLCSLVTQNSKGWRKSQPHDCEPPEWCPMRRSR